MDLEIPTNDYYGNNDLGTADLEIKEVSPLYSRLDDRLKKVVDKTCRDGLRGLPVAYLCKYLLWNKGKGDPAMALTPQEHKSLWEAISRMDFDISPPASKQPKG